MAVPRNPDARRYYRAAGQRLEDARLILDRVERTTAAVYLAGYCVECLLKALILAEAPGADRKDLLSTFRGKKAHDFDALRELYYQVGGARLPVDVADDLAFVGTWDISLRYDPRTISDDDAEAFLAAVERFWQWADRRL